jgi:hypothetical protein
MGTGTQTTESTPWGPQGKRFKQLFRQADELMGNELEYYPGSTIAERNPWQTMANINVADLVQNDQAGMRSALRENQMTTSGQYLDVDSNPWLRGVGEAAADDISRSYNTTVMPQIASRFGGAGRSAGPGDVNNAEGSAIASSQRGLGQELSQMYSNLYGGAYESERGRMGSAVGQAPGLRQAQFTDQAALSAAGSDEFQYAQMQLSDLVNRFNFEQYEPWERMGMYQGLISQPGGYGTDKAKSAIGAAQIAGMGASFAGPMGSALASG